MADRKHPSSLLLDIKSNKSLYWTSLCYIALLLIGLFSKQYFIIAVPCLFLIVYAALYALDLLLLLTAFITPLSINLSDIGLGYGISLPSEPLLFGMMLLFFMKLFHDGGFDRNVLSHPITIIILINTFWLLVTALTSSIPIVSIKYFISRLWFITTMFFLCTQLFRNSKNIRLFIILHGLSLFIVIAYTLYRHAENRFTEHAAHWVMTPFYNDHTIYAAIIAMFLPMLIIFSFNTAYKLWYPRIWSMIGSITLIVAIILSYTRAAWVGLVAALLTYILIKFRIRLIYLALASIVLLSTYFIYKTEIAILIKGNKTHSSTDYDAHLKSITNVSTDASNKERINRWNCAYSMYKERPVLGWGPGTYRFKYGPFQKSADKTIISTDFGEVGGAHSEYLGPLAESGFLGFASIVVLVTILFYRGVKLYYALNEPTIKALTLGLILGLVTYFVHGLLNNFLDTDKGSVPVWAFIAAIVAIDLYHRKENSVEPNLNMHNS